MVLSEVRVHMMVPLLGWLADKAITRQSEKSYKALIMPYIHDEPSFMRMTYLVKVN